MTSINLSLLVPELNHIIDSLSANENYKHPDNLFCVKKINYRNMKYTIISYNRDNLKPELYNTVGHCRSIILNENNKVISVSPSKSTSFDLFQSKYNDSLSKVMIEEFVDGTMINLFWDPCIDENGDWEISTKNMVGGDMGYFNFLGDTDYTKSFRKMFFETCTENNIHLNSFNKKKCYSFVLQHAHNRIVTPIYVNKLYLIHCCEIQHNDRDLLITYANRKDMKTEMNTLNSLYRATIHFPYHYNRSKTVDINDLFIDPNLKGAIFRNIDTNEHTKIRNKNYEKIKKLRGNQCKLQYRYLELRQENKVNEFIFYYPECIRLFNYYENMLHRYTHTLRHNYISCFIKKEKLLSEYLPQYKTHMYNIHQIYLNDLKPNNQYVSLNTVINYVNNCHPSLTMYSINYHYRKQNVDYESVNLRMNNE